MSLASSGMGGAGAGGGMSMGMAAHGGPSAMATHQQATGGRAGAGAEVPPGTTAAPVNVAALGADQLDKNQNLNWKQINKVAEMPIVAVDLYGDKSDVAYYPSVKDEKEYESPEDWIKSKHAGRGSCLVVKKNDEASYKALRRLLSKSKGYETVFEQSCSSTDKKDSTEGKVPIPSPQLLLGARQVKQLHKATAGKYTIGEGSNHAIDEDASSGEHGLTIQDGNLDGSNNKQGNDFDRVTLNLKLLANKKTLTMLPEEAVGILVAKAKHSVHKLTKGKSDDEDDNAFLEYPPAFALPAWACFDNTIDSLMDACHGTNAVLYQRSVAALAGALVPRVVIHEKKHKLKNVALYDLILEKMKEHEKKTQIAQQQNKPVPNQSYSPMVIMAGLTDSGLELTAIEVKSPNPTYMQSDCHVPFGEFKVISSVAFHHSNPLSLVAKSFCSLTDIIDEVCPELEDDGGVAAIVTYGSIEKQLKMKEALSKTLDGIKDDEVWKPDITFNSSKEEAVAVGTAILAAVSHARIERPSVEVKNISPTAVGLSYNFSGDSEGSSWSNPKIVFDYDRRVPAGPTKIEFSAAECVVLKENQSLFDDMEKLVEESQKWSKQKFNNVREEAALNLRVRVMQRMERDGSWKQVGDVMKPLTKISEDSDDGDNNEGSAYAIETSTLDLSLDSIGFLSASLCSDGQSIEQALKSAQSSSFWKYFRYILAIGFVGGFLVKSFIEDRIRERDVKRLLGFYKQNVPGSINDGDRNNAYYLCWKYKGKKDKLWKRLESKYGEPILTLKEYEELEAEQEAAAAAEKEDDAKTTEEEDDENVDLDEEDNTKEEL